ncbi:MAG TPA: FAD-dependent oxidoreductase [Stellaceae bacterium]
MTGCDVLIVGAGPTGLVLALWLTKLGVKVRIIDKAAEPGTTSRALAVHARTLELYHQLDLADAVIAKGHNVPAINLWVRGERRARVSFEDIGADITRYPFLHIFPQDEHERLLIERLVAFGISVERPMELLGFDDRGERIAARLRLPGGEEESCEAAYLAGCDGARSRVREMMGTGFAGATYRQVFYVADVEAAGPAIDGQAHGDLDEADFLVVFPLADDGRVRLIGTVRDERANHAESLTFDDISTRAIDHLKVVVQRLNWFSAYHVHHRVAEHFRKGRAFVLGDAAHIHSPVGGQGMNTGIGDAVNLAWKLQAVLSGRTPDHLLDSYERERIAFARRLVDTTDRVFTFITAEGRVAELVRTRIAPLLIPAAAKFEAAREWMFRTVSQVMINYRGGPLSVGEAGDVKGGDRLPWIATRALDNYRPLADMGWQVHVYGEARPELRDWCGQYNLPIHVFGWQPEFGNAGLRENALYLLRPDTYIALADGDASPDALRLYFEDRAIQP